MAAGPDARTARLERLLDVGRALTSELDLDALLDRILQTARELTGAQYAALGILDERRRELAQFLTSGIEPERHAAIGSLPRGRGVLGLLIDDPRPLRLDDVQDHPRSYGFPPGHPPMGAFLGTPVLVRGEAWGNLYLTEPAGGTFTDEDEEAVVVLAEWAGTAIANARLYRASEERRDELERAVRALQATRDIALAVGGETDLGRLLELVVKRARALVEADSLVILLASAEGLEVAAAAGRARPAPGAHVPAGGSPLGEVLDGGRARRLHGDALGGTLAALGVEAARAALLVPMAFRGRGLGLLVAVDPLGATVFDDEDERALGAFAASAATAVATAQTVEARRLRDTLDAAEAERKRWARELHDETLQGLGALKLALGAALRGTTGDAEPVLRAAVGQLEEEIAGLRALITELRPAALDELGLGPALRTLAARVTERDGLPVVPEVDLPDAERLAGELETVAYRVAQEALTNAVKHARATQAVLAARLDAGRLLVEVRDDGVGIAPEAPASGFGLIGMRERVELAGGTLEVGPAAGGGTRVALTLPR